MRLPTISFLVIASLLTGCALPPRLTFTPEEQAAIYQMNSSDPQIVAEGRRNLIALHPEWPSDVQAAASNAEVLAVRQIEPPEPGTRPDPPYADFCPFPMAVRAMTRTQTIAAWGYPSSRRAGGLNPPLMEYWRYDDTTPAITIRFNRDVMASNPDYQYNSSAPVFSPVPKGKFGFKKQSSPQQPKKFP